MRELENVEQKERIASEIKELVRQINDRINVAPFLKIRFEQTASNWVKNPLLEVDITETITY